MAESRSFFTDGAAYERQMGRWSHAAGETFLDWLALPDGLRWLDVGAGTGAFTELVKERCRPGALAALDPSEAQIAYAAQRPALAGVDFRVGDALSLPFADGAFDVAAMALVISFVPDPAKAVAEMRRVVRPGGTVATYIWDVTGGGFPLQPAADAINAMGFEIRAAGNIGASRQAALADLFAVAGLGEVSVRAIDIRCTYAGFDDLWDSCVAFAGGRVGTAIRRMSEADVERLKTSLRERLPADAGGRISHPARANAAMGRVPA